MDLPLSVALLMAHPVPFNVLEPMLDALPVDWAEVPTRRLVDALIEGSSEVRFNPLPPGKDDLARAVLPRLTWTSKEADAALVKAWAVGPGTTPHRAMAIAITGAVALFASPLGRTKALKAALQREIFETRYGAEHLPPLINRLLDLGCDKVWGGDSPYLTVARLDLFEKLQDHGFPLLDQATGQSLDKRLRERRPDSFETPSDRQKILAAVPAPELPMDQAFLYRLSQAQRWTDLRTALKEIGPGWTALRFEDGETVVHKVADKDPEWAVKLFALPAMRTAPVDITVDGNGQHLISRLMFSSNALKQAETLDHPAWTGWTASTTPVSLLTGCLREQRRRAQRLAANLPTGTMVDATALASLYWPIDAVFEPWLHKMGSSMADARRDAMRDPAFQKALDGVAWNWPRPQYGYYAVERLLDPVTNPFATGVTDSNVVAPSAAGSSPPLTWDWFNGLPSDTASWVATHALGMATRHLSNEKWSMEPVIRMIDAGANWETLERLFQEERLSWDNAQGRATVWSSVVRQRWETLQLNATLNDSPSSPVEPSTLRPRL